MKHSLLIMKMAAIMGGVLLVLVAMVAVAPPALAHTTHLVRTVHVVQPLKAKDTSPYDA